VNGEIKSIGTYGKDSIQKETESIREVNERILGHELTGLIERAFN